jgi:membrane associated rhomboid family serine protease
MNTEKRLFADAKIAAVPVAIIWAIHLIKTLGHFHWGRFGIYPREIDGIAGIFLAPLIHGDWQHLLSNSVPLFFMTVLILFFYPRVANITLILLYLITGLLVWLFARQVYHIGASGVVFAMISFVFWNGVFRKNLKSIVLSLVIIVMYGGSYFTSLVPGEQGISWESHLFGAITGAFVAFLFRKQIEPDEVEHDPWEGEDYTPNEYFLERDIFDRTKEERKREF